MELGEYLFKNKITGRDFAKLVGYDYTYISAVKNGLKYPGRKMRERIAQATFGQVTFDGPKTATFKVKATTKKPLELLENPKFVEWCADLKKSVNELQPAISQISSSL